MRLLARLYEERVTVDAIRTADTPRLLLLWARGLVTAVRVTRWEFTLTDKGVKELCKRTGIEL